jgi:ABC-2 type transport system permease protein
VSGYGAFIVPLSVSFGFCSFFYCLSTLFDERRDRSVLFWKSLPLSDRDTVLSKVAMVVVVAPLIAIAIAIATGLIAGLFICIAAAIAGVNIFSAVLTNSRTYAIPFMLLGTFPVYIFWALPTIGWLLLISAWARSKPFLWALGVPLLSGVLVTWINKMFGFGWDVAWFWKTIVGRLLGSVIPGSWMGFVPPLDIAGQGSPSTLFGFATSMSWGLFANPNIWIGGALGAAMIYAAIRLRGLRDEG